MEKQNHIVRQRVWAAEAGAFVQVTSMAAPTTVYARRPVQLQERHAWLCPSGNTFLKKKVYEANSPTGTTSKKRVVWHSGPPRCAPHRHRTGANLRAAVLHLDRGLLARGGMERVGDAWAFSPHCSPTPARQRDHSARVTNQHWTSSLPAFSSTLVPLLRFCPSQTSITSAATRCLAVPARDV